MKSNRTWILFLSLAAGGCASKDNVSFQQKWTSEKSAQKCFDLLKQAFEDSSSSSIWPKSRSRLKAEQIPLRKGGLVEATYKMGPFMAQASYTIERLEPPRLISYKASPDHQLAGGATIRVEPVNGKGCQVHWRGNYRAKSFKGNFYLIWFKKYYEKRFFEDLKARF